MEIYETLSCSNTVSKFCKTTILNLGINLNGGDPGTLNYDFWGIANVGSGGQFRIENSAITIGNKIISNKPLIQKILACSKLGSGCNAHAMQGWLKTSTTWGNFINNLNSRRAVSINISLGLESLPQQFTPDTEIELECKLKHS